MKNPTAAILAEAVALRASGASWKDILAATGLSHSQAEIAYFRATLPESDFVDTANFTEADYEAAAVALRQAGRSWGIGAILLGVPESKFRTLYKKGAGRHSEGQRIGKGGRWLFGDQEIYQGELRRTGTEVEAVKPKVREVYRQEAVGARLIHLEMDELKAMAADHGIEVKKGATKAQVVGKIRKALVSTNA